MTSLRTVLLAVCGAFAIGACGEDEPTSSAAPAAVQTTEGAAPAEGSSGGERCQDVAVPGHRAVDVLASGADCAAAERVAAAAEGRGRAPYDSGGFACAPSDASGGDTTYRCTMGPATITFLYGTT
jgi:hypothetical protein